MLKTKTKNNVLKINLKKKMIMKRNIRNGCDFED